MNAHSKIGASGCERWWNCPGSIALIETLPPQPDSPYAQEGTAAHSLAEQCLKNDLNAVDLLEKEIMPGFIVTEEMAEAVQVYLDVIRADMAKYKVHKSDLSIEHRFHLTHVDNDAYGTNDANLKVAFTKIIVYDYKHGSGVAVDAEDNKQGLYYGVGAAVGEEFDQMEIVIVQPRAIHKDGPVRRWTVSLAQLSGFTGELKKKIEATKNPYASRVCGPWCKKTFCPALAVCPEVQTAVMTESQMVFKEAKAHLPAVETLTPLHLRRILEAIPLIDAWTAAVWAHAESLANQGQEVLGFKLVRGREGNRKWRDEKEVAAKFGEHCLERSVMSPTKFEKQLGKKDFAQLAAYLVTRSEGKIIMVPENDPREVVQPNVIDVFKQDQLT